MDSIVKSLYHDLFTFVCYHFLCVCDMILIELTVIILGPVIPMWSVPLRLVIRTCPEEAERRSGYVSWKSAAPPNSHAFVCGWRCGSGGHSGRSDSARRVTNSQTWSAHAQASPGKGHHYSRRFCRSCPGRGHPFLSPTSFSQPKCQKTTHKTIISFAPRMSPSFMAVLRLTFQSHYCDNDKREPGVFQLFIFGYIWGLWWICRWGLLQK